MSSLVCLASNLTRERTAVAGEAFFVSDCDPVNNFEFFRPIFTGLGYPFPVVNIPFKAMFYVAWAVEEVHARTRHFYDFQPLTRAGMLPPTYPLLAQSCA